MDNQRKRKFRQTIRRAELEKREVAETAGAASVWGPRGMMGKKPGKQRGQASVRKSLQKERKDSLNKGKSFFKEGTLRNVLKSVKERKKGEFSIRLPSIKKEEKLLKSMKGNIKN